jgi:hypothetical protein
LEEIDPKKYSSEDVTYLNFLLEKGLKRMFRNLSVDLTIKVGALKSVVKIRNFTTVWVIADGKQIGRIQPLDSKNDGKNPQMWIVEGTDYTYQKPLGLPMEELASKALEASSRAGLILPTNPIRFREVALGQLKKENLFSTLIEMLGTILPNVHDLFFIEESTGDKVLWVQDGDKTYPFSQLGFGSFRLLQIFSEFLLGTKSEDWILLVDEIDLGLHYTVQEKVWEVLFYWAKKLNVQLFATTHSRDCFEAFAKVSNKYSGEGKFIRLQEFKGRIEAVEYDEKSMGIASESDYEVR